MENQNQHRTLMGILSYLGPLVIISLLASKDDSFVKFHAKQGLVLLVLAIILWVLTPMLWAFWSLWGLVKLVILIFAVFGIVNVVGGKEKELPLIGHFAKYFTF